MTNLKYRWFPGRSVEVNSDEIVVRTGRSVKVIRVPSDSSVIARVHEIHAFRKARLNLIRGKTRNLTSLSQDCQMRVP